MTVTTELASINPPIRPQASRRGGAAVKAAVDAVKAARWLATRAAWDLRTRASLSAGDDRRAASLAAQLCSALGDVQTVAGVLAQQARDGGADGRLATMAAAALADVLAAIEAADEAARVEADGGFPHKRATGAQRATLSRDWLDANDDGSQSVTAVAAALAGHFGWSAESVRRVVRAYREGLKS